MLLAEVDAVIVAADSISRFVRRETADSTGVRGRGEYTRYLMHKVRRNSDGLSEVGLSHNNCEVCESRWSEGDSK